ncbi:MAG: DNA repair protein RecN, partial [Oscillospiraceae bacterium]|nr:DNA repair protein RecN [Oscillospiraceae bacterium]
DLSPHAIAALSEIGLAPDEDGQLLIQRVIAADGKGACRVNGAAVTAALLRQAGEILVNIHGQHDSQGLLRDEKHIEYLDRLGHHEALLDTYKESYRALLDIRRRLKDADMDEAAKARRLDMLQYQIQEIETAKIKGGEEDELLARRSLCRNAERVAQSLLSAKTLLLGDDEADGALAMLESVAGQLRDVGRFVETAATLSERLAESLTQIDDCAEDMRGLTEQLDMEPGELDRIESRLDILSRLKTKYGDAAAFLEKAKKEYEKITLSDELVARLKIEEKRSFEEATARAAALRAARQRTAKVFTENVVHEMAFLDMPQVRFDVEMNECPLGQNGGDEVRFLLSANPGEEPRPLSRIASGGELSRIMLAIKAVLADADDIDTLIFDEIDAGVSGRAAGKIGQKLKETARARQVLCVTHLAPIAAQADTHLLIEKQVRGGRTYTSVKPLDREERERELARIIGGEATAANREAAREMLGKSK